MKRLQIPILLIIFAFAALFPHIDPAAADNPELSILTIWDAAKNPSDPYTLDFSTSQQNVKLERSGFERGLAARQYNFKINELMLSESTNITTFATELANIYNNNEILFVIGGSGDVMTMYASMETEFFSIPFLVPFADGYLSDTVSSSYTVRLTPNTENYISYITGSLIFPQTRDNIESILFENRSVPEYDLSVAVFFQNNYNGNDLAVNITQNLMDYGLNIEFYQPFSSGYFNSVYRSAREITDADIFGLDLVIIIGEDKADMYQLEEALIEWGALENPPTVILLGFTSGTVSDKVFSMSNVFAVRQYLDMSQCPDDITNQEEAMGYAAGYTTGSIMQIAYRITEPEPSGIRSWFMLPSRKQEMHKEYLTSLRSSIRLNFSDSSLYIPCYGYLSLDASGGSSNLELVRFTGTDTAVKVDEGEIFARLLERVGEKTGTPYQ